MKSTRFGKRTVTITEAAQILGIGRNQAYDAAHAGTLPTIAFGERKGDGRPTRYLVPVAALERLLSMQDELQRTAPPRAAKGEIP
jgi:excisionase family DNA binding protein